MTPRLKRRSEEDYKYVWNGEQVDESLLERFIGGFYNMCSPNIRKGRILVQKRALTWWAIIMIPQIILVVLIGMHVSQLGFAVAVVLLLALINGACMQFNYVTYEFSRLNLLSER